MMIKRCLCAILLAVLPTLAPAQVSVPEADGNGVFAASWVGDGAGSFFVVWRPVLNADGRVLVCGVWTVNNNAVMPGVRKILSRAVVQVDGQNVKRGLRGFAQASTQRAMETTAPTCIETAARGQWSQIAIRFGDGSFRD